jgi:hypothetical protein
LIVRWRLLWMLGSSSRLSSSAERFRVWEIIGWLMSMLCSDLSQHWISAYESVGLHFLWLHRAMRTSSIIVVYFSPFFGMVGCWGRARPRGCGGGVDGETTFAKVPTTHFKPIPPLPPSTPPTPIYTVIRRGLKWPSVWPCLIQ